MLGFGGMLLGSSCLYLYLSPKLPPVEKLKEIELQIPLRIHSQDLKVIAEFGEKKRSPVTYDQLPQAMIDAFLAAEDDRFFKHRGVDLGGLLRAASELVSSGEIRSGGSTITMQVARNFFLSSRQEFTRKFNEILLALKIERELSKQEILALYANKIYLGHRAYGVGAAAQVYYGKSVDQLDLPEIAMIAGLPKAPSRYNPLTNRQRAVERRNWILGRMQALGSISADDMVKARAQPDTSSFHGSVSELNAAYAAEMVRQEVINRFGLDAYEKGYQAITTLDSRLQHSATEAVRQGLIAYDQRHGYRGPEQTAIAEENWSEALRNTPTLGNLEPAIVTEVAEDHLQLLSQRNETLELGWQDGLEGLRRFRTVNAREAPISSAEEIFTRGDLIRIIRVSEDAIKLAQLPRAQAALVALTPDDGAIRAIVGGFDYVQSRFNRATQAQRQPGSNFKPFIYATALKTGFTPATLINDAPIVFDDNKLEDLWRPENDGGKFYGPTRLREALYRSRNLVSIRLLRRMGIDRTLSGIQDFGYKTSDMPLDLSLALGSTVLTPLQVATGYAAFANGGFRVSPYLLDKVIDRDGEIIYQALPDTVCKRCEDPDPEESSASDVNSQEALQNLEQQMQELLVNLSAEKISQEERSSWEALQTALQHDAEVEKPPAERAIDARTAFLMDSILKDVIIRGTGTKAKVLNRSDIAGKTGTTNGPRDAWFSGYSPHIVASAWVGFDDNSVLGRNEYGGSAALPIWINFMRDALAGKPERTVPLPDGIVMVKINPKTGARVNPGQSGIFEYFRTEDVPELQAGSNGSDTGPVNPLPDDLF